MEKYRRGALDEQTHNDRKERRTFDQSSRDNHGCLNVTGNLWLASDTFTGRSTNFSDAQASAKNAKANTNCSDTTDCHLSFLRQDNCEFDVEWLAEQRPNELVSVLGRTDKQRRQKRKYIGLQEGHKQLQQAESNRRQNRSRSHDQRQRSRNRNHTNESDENGEN